MAHVIYTDNQGYRSYLEDLEYNYAGEAILAFNENRAFALSFWNLDDAQTYLDKILDQRPDMKGELFILDTDEQASLWKLYDDAMRGVI